MEQYVFCFGAFLKVRAHSKGINGGDSDALKTGGCFGLVIAVSRASISLGA
jgi:hypothetical protein